MEEKVNRHKILAQITDGPAILISFKSNLSTSKAINAIKNAVTNWGVNYESGQQEMDEIENCFNWGDFNLCHEIETLKRELKIAGIRGVKTEVLGYEEIVDHDEILFKN